MSASTNVDSDLELLREDLGALKRDVANLIEHMKGGATNTVQNAAGQVERRVGSLRQQAGAEGDRSAKAFHLFVQDQPLVALTIADRLRRRARASTVSQSSTASDLFQIALAVLRPGAAPVAPRPTGSFPRRAVLELSALLCGAAAFGCGLVALWIYASPMLGAAGGLLVVSAVLCAVGFAAFVFDRRARDRHAPSPLPSLASGFADDA